jgi:hypothetical protein
VNSKVAGVLVTDDEMAEFMGSGRAPTARISPQTDNGDRDIAVNDRCSISRDPCHKYELTSTLAEVYQGLDRFCAETQPLADP